MDSESERLRELVRCCAFQRGISWTNGGDPTGRVYAAHETACMHLVKHWQMLGLLRRVHALQETIDLSTFDAPSVTAELIDVLKEYAGGKE
jgi:hypothetical protein